MVTKGWNYIVAALWPKNEGIVVVFQMEGIAWAMAKFGWGDGQGAFGIGIRWQKPDGSREKGSKRSLLTDQKGVPLSIVLSGANTHDVKLLAATLDALVIERPEVEDSKQQHLCLDAGYVGEQARQDVLARNYVPHIRPRGEEIEEKAKNPDFKPKRWVVEVCHAWFNRFRKILVRYEKMERGYLGLLMLAASVIVFRKIKRQNQPNIIYG